MSTSFRVVIPARLGSTRLPRKPLAEIAGKPMIVHVAERARASGAEQVWIATDSEEIEHTAHANGLSVRLTSADHPSGSDRIAQLVHDLGWSADTLVVNVQGDEPLIAPALIRQVAMQLESHPAAAMATACHALLETAELDNPNVVKVVCDAAGYASYFSRAPIPYTRDAATTRMAFRHIGIYAYRADFLKQFTQLPPAPTEHCEALEQLRALWHGYKISVAICEAAPGPSIDTEDDLRRVRTILEARR